MIKIFDNLIKKLFPSLEIELRKAGRKETAEEYIKKYSKYPLIFSFLFSIFFLMVLLKEITTRNLSFLFFFLLLPIILGMYVFFTYLMFSLPKVEIINRKSRLESDILYSTRYLLLKLESGSPLLNALIDVSNLNTNSSALFNEIVTDIYLGTPIEQAVEKGIRYSPSDSFVKILEEIKNSLKTGSDIEKSLKNTLDDLTKEHLIKIKAYGKKLSPLSLLYMIIGTVIPALIPAGLVLVFSVTKLPSETVSTVLIILIIGLVVVQLFFIQAFKALKPQEMS